MDPELRDRESLLSADMAVHTHAEIKQLFLEFQAAGVTFFQALRKVGRLDLYRERPGREPAALRGPRQLGLLAIEQGGRRGYTSVLAPVRSVMRR
jgi:hypothetical protein